MQKKKDIEIAVLLILGELYEIKQTMWNYAFFHQQCLNLSGYIFRKVKKGKITIKLKEDVFPRLQFINYSKCKCCSECGQTIQFVSIAERKKNLNPIFIFFYLLSDRKSLYST